jgi:REP element-mobilizing transposase RayT
MNNNDLTYFFNRLLDLNTNENDVLIRLNRKILGGGIVDTESDKLVSVVSYCLLPNHFHLLLKQEQDNGITKFMQRLGTSYTMFFNRKYERNGPLFAGKFKAKLLEGDFALPTISAYINLNYKYHQIDPKENLIKSSIFEFLGTEFGVKLCDNNEIQKILKEIDGNYTKYLENISQHFITQKGGNPQNLIFDEFEK